MSYTRRAPSRIGRIQAKFRDFFIPTPGSVAIKERLQSVVSTSRYCSVSSGVGAASLTVIEAEDDCGLTRAVRWATKEIKDPILWIDMPVASTPHTLNAVILSRLGDPCAHRHNAMSAFSHRSVLKHLKAQGIRMMIFDDVHHGLLTRTGDFEPSTAGWLKSLIEAASVPVVLMGKNKFTAQLFHNYAFTERPDCYICLRPFDWTADKITYAYVLAEFESHIAKLLKQRSALSTGDLPKKIHNSTKGAIGLMARLLARALELALHRTTPPETITEADLYVAYDTLRLDAPNPFLCSSQRRIA